MSDEPKLCHDCGARPGELHDPGCDVEICPRCGGQMISCPCVYEVNGLDEMNLEEDHPDIYTNGPTDEMVAKWDAEWESRRMPWTGEWPGAADCRALGFWSRWEEGRGWVECSADHPDATEDLNKLHDAWAKWDQASQHWVARGGLTPR